MNSGSSLFNQSKQNVAEIAGEKINITEFSAAIEQMTNVYKIETGKTDFTEEMSSQLRTTVWDNMVNERILAAEAEKLGLSVSKEELSDRLIGKNIHPLILQRRVFMDEKGQFSRTNLLQFYNNIFENSKAQDQEQLKEAKNYWLFWEKAVKNAILQEKYSALFTKSVGANSIDAKYNYDARKTTADLNYVMQPYFAVSDSTVKVTDAEIKERYNKEKELFKQEANRSIKYVSFDVVPLQKDFNEAKEWMKKVGEEFKTTTDVAGVVNAESDVSYDGRNYSEKTVPANLKDFAFGNGTGAIYGPVFQNNTYTMARVMESGIMQSDSVKLRHIFLAAKDEKKADSIMGVLKSGANFGELAMKYSAIKETAAHGGEIGWITEGAIGKEISGPAFSKATNELFKVSSAQGIQIMQVMEKTPARRKVKLAILERKITPSSQSYSNIYNEAKQFAASSRTPDKFESNAKQKRYVINTAA
ncbi:MAG: PpiC-type peptidyl-prolyl cis-trans isomerase, partial [Bacteroidetes bacterium]|nr:PpiC-type peptidyl-prolyl cis-trans isomerase [Bacteroidota bacterium]